MERKNKNAPTDKQGRVGEFGLFEIMENPDAYSEEEILDMVHRNDDSRKAYKMMVEVGQGYRYRRAGNSEIDVDMAWERFGKKHLKPVMPMVKLRKAVAIIIVILAVSGVAIAAIYTMGRREVKPVGSEKATAVVSGNDMAEGKDSAEVRQISVSGVKVFDNVRLDDMLGEIAGHYGCKVNFRTEEIKGLRLHFQWNEGEPIEKVIEKLNLFESINVEREGQCLTVE